MSEVAMVAVLVVVAVLYNLKSIHIEFSGHDQQQNRRNKLLKSPKD
jgi:hypothetical protein